MKTLIAYESQTGHTRQAAEAIARGIRALGSEVTLKSVRQVQSDDVRQADVLFLGTWVRGHILFNVKPAGVKEWIPNLPSITGKPVGVFCTYAFNPDGALRLLGTMIEERGAILKGECSFHRNRPDEGADTFARFILASVSKSSSL